MNLAFYNGISGVKSQQSGIDVWGHNISNSNLSGYRASRPEFSNLFTSSLSSSTNGSNTSSQVGYGSQLITTATTRDQGSFSTTDNTFDLAIDGNGWFGLFNADEDLVFSRNGGFKFDADRYLVDENGAYVSGTMGGNIVFEANAENNRLTAIINDLDGGTETTQEKLQLPNTLTYPKQYTDTVTIGGNLGTSEDSVSLSSTLYSASEEANTLYVTLTKSDLQPATGSSWSIQATVLNEDGSIQYDKKTGSINFGTSGEILDFEMPQLSNDGLAVNLNFGSGTAGLQANDSENTGTSIQKNGQPEGQLDEYSITKDGDVVAFFDNGYKTIVAKVAVYHFRNEQGLQEIGGSYYMQTDTSGDALFYRDEMGEIISTAGQVYDHTIEEANINTTEALSELMMIQRAFDANSKSITTGDSLIQTALNMAAR